MTAEVVEPAAKTARLDAASANVVTVQLVSADGDKAGTQTFSYHNRVLHVNPAFQRASNAVAGTQLQLPQATTRSQLQTLLNQILKNEEPLPYAFYIDEVELADEIGVCMVKNKVSVERVVQVLYQPQAVFRVRPVARCSATMEGKYIPPHLCASALLTISAPKQVLLAQPLRSQVSQWQ
jgi:NLE (NUC135) domain